MLGKKYTLYKEAERILAFLESVPEDPKERLPMSKNPDKNDKKYGMDRLLAEDYPEYNYPGLSGLLKSASERYTAIYDDCGKAVQRVKDNLKHGQCPICRVNMNEADVECVILKCCSVVQ